MESALAVALGYIIPGIAIAVGLLLVVIRLGRKRGLWLLGHPLLLEVVGIGIAWWMHGGTIVGGMAVVVAGIIIHFSVDAARYAMGYIKAGVYYPGKWVQYDPRTLR